MGLLAVFIAASLFVGTFAVIGTDVAFADGKKKDGKKKFQKNEAEQVIAQQNANEVSSLCAAGLINLVACDSINAQLNLNLGSNALSQSNE